MDCQADLELHCQHMCEDSFSRGKSHLYGMWDFIAYVESAALYQPVYSRRPIRDSAVKVKFNETLIRGVKAELFYVLKYTYKHIEQF